MEFRSELDRYLLDACAQKPPSFYILDWWKINATNYPIIAQFACDVLAILISTIA